MPLYIRDNSVDALAEKLKGIVEAPSKTEAVRIALQNEIHRRENAVPLAEKIAVIQRQRRERNGPNAVTFDTKAFTEEGSEI